MDSRLNVYEEKMEKSLNNLEEEYAGIRAGRANPHVLDKLRVDYYGTPTPIQNVANVSVPEARMIQIQPWEGSLVKEIEKAIMMSDLGITPTNDGKVIRLVFPDLTASIMCMENKMPMYVFGLNEENSIVKAMSGEFAGTKVTV